MKNIKTYLLLLFVSFASASYAVFYPANSFFGANEEYAENHDQIEYSIGTQVRNINMIISTVNSGWGDICTKNQSENVDQATCQDCCTASWENEGYTDAGEVLYNKCMEMCGGGPSLPLGSTLWLLPFVFAYAGVKKYRKAQN
jgi:hypothetical protein